ncbi:hypothetical protein KVR01_002726 [Diaporthe batatas]|uniref:uncharacterized protein n=1 Tax=Diaporthe batatas TaxID=748121 RepID=UPI001D04A675|nr:uncharacterized protein KVR01_002726 [Diaporthe batatas]KAG8167037.1 hypothetical protein KVR01_002726 [Diaporthe batatas]
MPTIHVQAGSSAQLQEIADSLWKAKKVVVVTGAGISTNSGIPDFRSENGLYSMIQSQFDAAARLDGAKTRGNGVLSDDSGDELRPKKRRKLSLVGDTIEVGGPNLDRDATVEGDSIKVLGPDDSLVSDVTQGENHGDQDPVDETKPGDHDERVCEREEPGEEEADLLSEESVLVGEASFAGPDAKGASQRESANRGQCSEGAHNNSHVDSQCQAQPISAAASSRRPSRRSSPAPEALSSHQEQQDIGTSGCSAPKSPNRSADTLNATSSGSSTPKQTSSDSGAQTNTFSSPLSSPPPILSDPYEEAFHHSPTSSSRCTSPESASEAENSPPSLPPFSYSQTFKRASLSTMKGRDLFDASIWSDPVKTSVFYTFATNLRQKSREAYPTGSHHFISHLRDSGRMVRCYTQNIDLLEDKVGLSTRLLLGPGSRSRFSARASRAAAAAAIATATAAAAAAAAGPAATSTSATPIASCPADGSDRPEPVAQSSRPSDECQEEEKNGANDTTHALATEGAKDQCQQGDAQTVPSSPEPDRGVECVYLHGSLRSLRCFQCGGVIDWDEGDREMQTMSGNQPPCPRCEDATTARQEKGKRALGVGKLRPDIVLYGEEHPESQRISDIIQHDLSLAPDLLIIMGTSLKVHGLKTVVKEFAKAIHNKKDGKVIFINYTKPADSVWADTIDFWVEMDCDAWVNDLKKKKPIIWSPPGTIAEEPRNTKRRRRTNVDLEKAAAGKGDVKGEGADDSPMSEPKVPAKKAEKKCARPPTKPSAPKPAPKRPVSEREHKDNGAYWTTRIMSNLALLTGRQVKKYSTMSATPAPAKKQPGAGQPVYKPAEPEPAELVAPKLPLNKGRGPRLKNARTRKRLPEKTSMIDAANSDVDQDSTGHQNGQVEDQKPKAGTLRADCPGLQQKLAIPGDDRPLAAMAEAKPDPDLTVTEDQSFRDWKDDPTPVSQACQKPPVLDLGVSPDTTVESNSILAAVKSHHRIRKPKAIFEPETICFSKSGRGTPASSAVSAKPRAKPAQARTAQAKKNKGAGKAVKTEVTAPARMKESVILPPPIPIRRPVPKPKRSKSPDPGRSGNPDESCRLAPLHPENLEGYNLQKEHNDRPYPLAKPLEPIVIVEGPPSDMSPTSPQHWQNRAFHLRDPQSRNFEGPCRGLDFVGLTTTAQPDGQNTMTGAAPPAPPPTSQLATQLAMITVPPSHSSSAFASAPIMLPHNAGFEDVHLPLSAQSIHDSPSRQLHQEEALEAAAALNQLRRPPVFDERRFMV